MDAYRELILLYRDSAILSSVSSLLYWDMNITMPPAAGEFRSIQANVLTKYNTKIFTSVKFSQLLREAEKMELDPVQQRNLELMQHSFKLATHIPTELMTTISEHANVTLQTWKEAKKRRDFSVVRDKLQRQFELQRTYGEHLQELFQTDSPHSGLVHLREPGTSVRTIKELFCETRKFLVPLIEKVTEAQQDSPYVQQFPLRLPRDKQVRIVHDIARHYNYDFESPDAVGRIDEVEHPLTFRLGPRDVRVSVKYHEEDLRKAVFATHHELGHAIDALGANQEWNLQPINSRRFPSIGECNSRFTENKIGKSWEFWSHHYDTFNEVAKLPVDARTFLTSLLTVHPSTSRIGSDELTYAMHIIIRFEIEERLFSDKATIPELPSIWNELYEKYLGVTPADDTEGVMQDLHWYSVYWAYFQGYALGDIFGSQLYYHMPRYTGDNFPEIRRWLTENVFSLGARYDPLETIEKVTGRPVDVKYHRRYLTEKYAEIFDFSP